MNSFMRGALCLALLLPSVAGAKDVRIYDLNSGTISVLKYKNTWHSGHGTIKGKLITGQIVEGEFATVAAGSTGWGSIYGTGGYASGTVTAIAAQQPGSAILTGDGIVIECEYIVSAFTGHGSGFCRDNQGNRYRLIF